MKRLSRVRPSPALIVAMIVLALAMTGAAVALPGKNTVGKNDIKKGAVTKSKIARNAVGSQQVKGKSLKGNDLKDGAINTKQIKDDAVNSSKVEPDSLNSSDLSDYEVLGEDTFVKVTATEAATEAAARAAAPETELFSKGDVSLYAKCFRETGAAIIHGEIIARTTANGAILQGNNNYPNDDATLLDTNTAEDLRVVHSNTEANPNAGSVSEAESVLIGPDGTDLHILDHIAVKQGTFPGGDGAFGAGNVCLFGGAVTG